MWWQWLLWIVGAYVCGSVPIGLLMGRARGVDVRTVGSGNIGATNVGRALGRKWGIVCFWLDVAKGALPVVAAGWSMDVLGRPELSVAESWWWLSVAASPVLGHVFPIWLGFRGGKGVATGAGVLLGVWPLLTAPVLIALGVWIVSAASFRYVGLSSVLAAGSLPVTVLVIALLDAGSMAWRWPFLVITLVLALLVLARHRGNLARITRGEEPKLGNKRTAHEKAAAGQPDARA